MSARETRTDGGAPPRRAPRAGVVITVCAAAVLLLVVLLTVRPGGVSPDGAGTVASANAPAPGSAPRGAPADVPVPTASVPGGNAPPQRSGRPVQPPAAAPGSSAPAAPDVNAADLPPDHPPIQAVEDGAQVSLQWLGHACFYIHSPGQVAVVTDPFDPKATGLPAPATGAHLITISSETPAHNYPAAIHTFPGESGRPLPKRVLHGDLAREKDVRILPIPTVGGESGGNRNYAYVIEAGPLRIAHLGALGRPLDPAQVKAFGAIDILLVPAGGGRISPAQAAEVAKQLNPRVVIPMSYSTPDMGGPDGRLRPIQDFVAASPFAVEHKEYDVMMVSKGSLPPSTEVWTLRYRH